MISNRVSWQFEIVNYTYGVYHFLKYSDLSKLCLLMMNYPICALAWRCCTLSHFDFVLDFVKLNLSWTFFFINYVENETVFYVLHVFWELSNFFSTNCWPRNPRTKWATCSPPSPSPLHQGRRRAELLCTHTLSLLSVSAETETRTSELGGKWTAFPYCIAFILIHKCYLL